MIDQSSAETAIDKVRMMIDAGWTVMPVRPNQRRPARTGWNERSFTLFLQVWCVSFFHFEDVANWLRKQLIQAERGNADQWKAMT
jgi:hypothetical protein